MDGGERAGIEVDDGGVDGGGGVDPVDPTIGIPQGSAGRVQRQHFAEFAGVVIDVIGRDGIAIDIEAIGRHRACRTGAGVSDADQPVARCQLTAQRFGGKAPREATDRLAAGGCIQHHRACAFWRDQLDAQIVDVAVAERQRQRDALDLDGPGDVDGELGGPEIGNGAVERARDGRHLFVGRGLGIAEAAPDFGKAHSFERIDTAKADIVGVVQAAAIDVVGLVDRPAGLHATRSAP